MNIISSDSVQSRRIFLFLYALILKQMRRLSLIFLLISALLMLSCIKDDVRGADLKVGDSLPDF